MSHKLKVSKLRVPYKAPSTLMRFRLKTHTFWCIFAFHPHWNARKLWWKRRISKPVSKVEPFENASHRFWRGWKPGARGWKRIEVKTLTSSDDTENRYFWKRISEDSWKYFAPFSSRWKRRLENAFKASFFTHSPRCSVPTIWTPEIGLKMTEMFNHFVFQNKYFLTLKILATC